MAGGPRWELESAGRQPPADQKANAVEMAWRGNAAWTNWRRTLHRGRGTNRSGDTRVSNLGPFDLEKDDGKHDHDHNAQETADAGVFVHPRDSPDQRQGVELGVSVESADLTKNLRNDRQDWQIRARSGSGQPSCRSERIKKGSRDGSPLGRQSVMVRSARARAGGGLGRRGVVVANPVAARARARSARRGRNVQERRSVLRSSSGRCGPPQRRWQCRRSGCRCHRCRR